MAETEGEPRVVIALAVGSTEVPLRRVGPDTRCDLALVDDILRLRLNASRLGCSLRLTHVAPYLQELFDLVGLGDLETEP